MRFGIFGGLRVEHDGRPVDLGGPKQRAVLAALVVDVGRPISPDRLIDLVWGEDPPANPETSLQAYVSNLRRALEPGRKPREPARLLVTQPAGYALLAAPDDVDATRFAALVDHGQALLATGDAANARDRLDEALALWVGPPLPELAGDAWVTEVRARLEDVRALALEARVDAGLALGEHGALVPRLTDAVGEFPFRERLRAQLSLALYRSGRQRDALAALNEARTVLVEEIGVEPGRELRTLEAAILDQDPALDAPAAPAPQPASAPGPSASGGPGAAGPPTRPAAGAGRGGHDVAQRRGTAGAGRPFVGRTAELATLCAAADQALGGAGRPVVICGEPGIGKTRLVEELLAGVADRAAVAWGRCPESAASAAYWPCIQLGRQLEGAGVLPGEVRDLLPADDVVPVTDDPAADRLNLHVAIVKVLRAADRPVVLVVDDVQWADPASLRAVEFLAGELASMPVLLVVTVRPMSADASSALIECLGELARAPGAVRIDLGGLSTVDVLDWLRARGAGRADPGVAELVHDRTAGNAFFIGEVVELLSGEDRLTDLAAARQGTGVPGAVQDVVRRRVGRLPAETQSLLVVASVVGRTFDVDVLAAITGDAVVDVLDRLDPALEAGLVDETDLPGRLQFSHALVAETLEAELASGRRARLHAATAQAIAELRGPDLDPVLPELAHHAFEGAAAGLAVQAYEWSVAAARQASAQRAHEDAALQWRRAVRALEVGRAGDRGARFEALYEQGRAWLRVDDVGAAYGALVEAVNLAIALGDTERVGRAAAAMSLEGLWQAGEVGLTSVDAVDALERSLAVLPDEPSAERALVLGALAENAYWSWPTDRLDATTSGAVDVARATGDPAVLGRALQKRNQTMWWSATLDIREASAAELLVMAEDGALPGELDVVARFSAAAAWWEKGDVGAAAHQVEQARRRAAELGTPALITQLDYFASAIAAFQGRLDDAHRLADGAYDLYRRTRRWAADTLYTGHKLTAWLEQGRVDEVLAAGPALLETDYRPWFQEGYAAVLVRLGLVEEAATIVKGQEPPLMDCWMYLAVLTAAAEVRVAIGDRTAAAMLAERLRPYAGRLAVAGTGPCYGDVHHPLALIARLLGDDEAARRHAEASVDVLARAGAGPMLARALLLRAEVVPAGAAEDRRRAGEIADRMRLTLLQRQLG